MTDGLAATSTPTVDELIAEFEREQAKRRTCNACVEPWGTVIQQLIARGWKITTMEQFIRKKGHTITAGTIKRHLAENHDAG